MQEIVINVEPIIINITINGTGSSFTLLYGSSESSNLTTDTPANQFESALTAIIDGANETDIVVVKDSTGNQTTFQVIFFKELLNTSNLEVGEYGNITIDINTIQTGRFPSNMVLSFLHRSSGTIILPSNSSIIEEQLYNMISVSCNKTNKSGAIYWMHTYDSSPGRVWGTVDNTINPMCGRYSLKNPTTIFRALASQDEITQSIKTEIPWLIYNEVKLCTANCKYYNT